MDLTTISWIITIGSISGAILNARKSIKGFYIWIVANLGWIVYNTIIQEYALSVLFFVYTVISIYGVYQWKEQKRTKNLSK